MTREDVAQTHCPFCGAPLPRRAPACPECGSDRETGWADETTQNAAAFAPFTDEDYDDVVADLNGAERPRGSRDWILALIAVITLAAFLLVYVM